MSTEQNKATVRRFFAEILNQRNLALVDELFAANYVNHSIPPGMPQGPEGEKIFTNLFLTGFPDFRMNLEDIIAEGDLVATRWMFEGTNNGAFQGMPATGKHVTFAGMNVWRVADAKIVDNQGSFDQLGMM